MRKLNQVDKVHQRHIEDLLKDPNINISIKSITREEELREKANIHKTRLRKYGKSKMNNQIYYQRGDDTIFICDDDGNIKII